jgi:hypothetical protein
MASGLQKTRDVASDVIINRKRIFSSSFPAKQFSQSRDDQSEQNTADHFSHSMFVPPFYYWPALHRYERGLDWRDKSIRLPQFRKNEGGVASHRLLLFCGQDGVVRLCDTRFNIDRQFARFVHVVFRYLLLVRTGSPKSFFPPLPPHKVPSISRICSGRSAPPHF